MVTLSKCSPQQMQITKGKVCKVPLSIIMIMIKFKLQIQKTNPRPACKVFLTSEVLRGLGGRRGTQLVIYKSLAKVSGSDDNVASILVFVVVVYICILIGVCVCICAILEEAVVPYPALDGALPHITIPPNHLPC